MAAEVHACRKKTDEPVDYSQLINLALRNGTAGFFYNNIKSLSSFPGREKQELQALHRKTAFHNLHQLGETSKLISLLAANGIRVIPLKGVVASEVLFHDLGVYPSGDIDVLIHPDDLEAALVVLKELAGYSPVGRYSARELLSEHYHFMLHNGSYLLEVHWNLTKRYFTVEPEFWWQDVQTMDWRGMKILEPAPEKYLMYAIFRLFDHCFFPLRFLLLVGALLEKHRDRLQVELLLRDSGRYGMRRLVVFSLHLARELTGARLPESFQEPTPVGYGVLKRLVVSGVLHGVERKHLRMMCYSLLLDSPAAVARALLGRLFPAKEELRLRYDLPESSFRIFFYYLLNPFLLLMKSRR